MKLKRVFLSLAAVTLITAPGALAIKPTAKLLTVQPLMASVEALLEKIYIGCDDINVACGALTEEEAEDLNNNPEFDEHVQGFVEHMNIAIEELAQIHHILEAVSEEDESQDNG